MIQDIKKETVPIKFDKTASFDIVWKTREP